jgi:porphobilinogen deaminase
VTPLRIGTRGSALALWQARTVASLIGANVEIVIIRTAGDERPRGEERTLPAAGAGPVALKRLFVKEIEDALLREEIDIAVHSAKDMSVLLPDGLAIGAVLPREDPRDALVVAALAGGTQLALGAIALHENGNLAMHAVVASPDGQRVIRRHARGPAGDAQGLGAMLAGELARAGAESILDEVRRSQ